MECSSMIEKEAMDLMVMLGLNENMRTIMS